MSAQCKSVDLTGQVYTPSYCVNNRSNVFSPDAPHMAPYLKCHKEGTHTLFGFETHHRYTPGGTALGLRLQVIRDLTGLENIDSPSWKFQSLPPATLTDMWLCWRGSQYERDQQTQLWRKEPRVRWKARPVRFGIGEIGAWHSSATFSKPKSLSRLRKTCI